MFDSIFEYCYHLPHLQRGKVRLKEITIPNYTRVCHQSVNTQALSPHMVEETDVKWQHPSLGTHSDGVSSLHASSPDPSIPSHYLL